MLGTHLLEFARVIYAVISNCNIIVLCYNYVLLKMHIIKKVKQVNR